MSQVPLRRVVRSALLALCLLGGMGTAAHAQIGIGVGIGLPGARIGINIPVYPQLVPIPGYPVYYAPGLDVNLFFYDGRYWLFTDDQWYASDWYNGPWYLVGPEFVPDFILRIPILYYRHPPLFFRHWNRYAPPPWGQHWGWRWQRTRPYWNRWNPRAVPPRAPLPRYQRQYPRSRYPSPREQRTLQERYYQYRRGAQRRLPGRPQFERQPQRQQRQPQRQQRPPQRQQRPPQRQQRPPQRQQRQPQRQQRQPQRQRDHERDRRPGGPPPG